MGADADMVKGALLAFEAGSPLAKADMKLRHLAHVYAKSTTADGKARALQALRRAAIEFTATESDAVKGNG